MSSKSFGTARRITVIDGDDRKTWADPVELWEYRELLWVLITRDVKVRYKQTLLGIVWAVLQPLLSMLLFSLIFGRLAKLPSDGLPYPVFVYAGLLPWMLFASTVSTASESVLGASTLISRVYFPRILIPLAAAGTAVVDFVIATVLLIGLMLYYGIAPSPKLLLAPALVAALVFAAVGVGTAVAALNVEFRDFRYLVPFAMQLWMFATPVVYPASMIPQRWQWAYHLNPLAGIVEGLRSTFLDRPLAWTAISISVAVSVAAFFLGVALFSRAERRFADVI